MRSDGDYPHLDNLFQSYIYKLYKSTNLQKVCRQSQLGPTYKHSSCQFLLPSKKYLLTMQSSRSYCSRKLRAGDPLQQPQGARPKSSTRHELNIHTSNVASVMQNVSPSRQVRALPAVPACPTTSARAHHMSRSSQDAHDRRPLPYCPTSSPVNSQPSPSSSTRRAAPTIEHSSAGVHSPPVALSIPVVLPTTRSSPSIPTILPSCPSPPSPKCLVGSQFELQIYDDYLSDDQPIEFRRPRRCDDPDCMSEDDEDSDSDIMEPYQIKRVVYNRFTDYRGILAKRTTPQQPTPESPVKKWVKERKGQRATIHDFDNLLHILRTL